MFRCLVGSRALRWRASAGCGKTIGEAGELRDTRRDLFQKKNPEKGPLAMTDSSSRTNRLRHETSPYLLQHAHNPVEWVPWGREAFEQARREDKPIFLSVGYAACHWCHVMAYESFEDEQIADYLNRHFVSIKVDREERPDVDAIYMQTVVAMTGQGGWPMSVFLTPEGKPFFGGTYFPPEARWGRVGFLEVLEHIQELWTRDRARIEKAGDELHQVLEGLESHGAAGAGPVHFDLLEAATAQLQREFDSNCGGFGPAPKFPPSMALPLLLREALRQNRPRLLEMAEQTLDRMAHGGIHDHLGGGFHRYAVDPCWQVPHFEKMLYDNVLLAPVYLDLSLLTGKARYEAVARGILDYVLREMSAPEGGFYASQDADSEGVEGRYYVWKPEEVREVLDTANAELFCEFYDITDQGNWSEGEGGSILNVPRPLEAFARSYNLDASELEQRLAGLRTRLRARREHRAAPGKDDKILANWNGLAISAMARATQVTGEPAYVDAGNRAARFILERMREPEGRLLHTFRSGSASVPGFLDDYAALILGLIDLYETTFDAHWIHEAEMLAERMIGDFHDGHAGGFFATDGRDPTVLVRLKDFHDGATPAGNTLSVHAFQRLGRLLGRARYRDLARDTLERSARLMRDHPSACHLLLCAVAFELAPAREVVVIGSLEQPETASLVQSIWRTYMPHRVLALSPARERPALQTPLFEGRTDVGTTPTVFVCQDQACRQPVHTAEQTRRLLQSEPWD